MTAAVVYSVDEVLVAAESVLQDHLATTVELLGYSERLGEIRTWQQLPTLEALSTARLPAIGLTSAGLVSPPTYARSSGLWTAAWRVSVGVYVRGKDHAKTAANARDWAAAVRMTLLTHKRLDGKATALAWVAEDYSRRPEEESAQTLAGAAVTFHVTTNVPGDLPTPEPGLPVVLSTHPTLEVIDP